MTVGAIFKATIADESDEERRELERYVPHLPPFLLFPSSLFLLQTKNLPHSPLLPLRLVAQAAMPHKKRKEAERKEAARRAQGAFPHPHPSSSNPTAPPPAAAAAAGRSPPGSTKEPKEKKGWWGGKEKEKDKGEKEKSESKL